MITFELRVMRYGIFCEGAGIWFGTGKGMGMKFNNPENGNGNCYTNGRGRESKTHSRTLLLWRTFRFCLLNCMANTKCGVSSQSTSAADAGPVQNQLNQYTSDVISSPSDGSHRHHEYFYTISMMAVPLNTDLKRLFLLMVDKSLTVCEPG